VRVCKQHARCYIGELFSGLKQSSIVACQWEGSGSSLVQSPPHMCSARRASILRAAEAPRAPAQRVAVQAFTLSARLQRSEGAKTRKLLFHLVSFEEEEEEEEEAAREQGCPPPQCVCSSSRACVSGERGRERERERKRERERYEGKTDRTRGAGDSRFWTRFGDRSCPTAHGGKTKHNNNRKRNLLCVASPFYSCCHRTVHIVSGRAFYLFFCIQRTKFGG